MKFRIEMRHGGVRFIGEGDRLYSAILAAMDSIEGQGCEVAMVEFADNLREFEVIAKEIPDEVGEELDKMLDAD